MKAAITVWGGFLYLSFWEWSQKCSAACPVRGEEGSQDPFNNHSHLRDLFQLIEESRKYVDRNWIQTATAMMNSFSK